MEINFNKLIEIEKNRNNIFDLQERIFSDIAILEGKTISEIKKIPVKELHTLIEKYKEFQKRIDNIKIKNEIKIDNQIYKIPDISDITFGQFVDIQETLKNVNGSNYLIIPDVLAIMLNPETDSKKYKKFHLEMIEKIKLSNFDEILSGASFFLSNARSKQKNSVQYLKNEEIKIRTQILMQKNLLKTQMKMRKNFLGYIMDGMQQLMIWPITTFLIRQIVSSNCEEVLFFLQYQIEKQKIEKK